MGHASREIEVFKHRQVLEPADLLEYRAANEDALIAVKPAKPTRPPFAEQARKTQEQRSTAELSRKSPSHYGRLFERLYARLQVEHDKDPATLLFNRTPIAFWSSRHGSLLTVDKPADARLLRITLDWEHRPGQPRPEPWTASVFRTADGARVALTGSMEGTVEDVVDDIVQAFLNRTAQVEGMS